MLRTWTNRCAANKGTYMYKRNDTTRKKRLTTRKLALIGLLTIAGCAAPTALHTPRCTPTVTQPAHGASITLVSRVTGCPNLVAVAGDAPGIILYVTRDDLDSQSGQIDALPEVQEGRN